MALKNRDSEFAALYNAAHYAGMEAVKTAEVNPMVVVYGDGSGRQEFVSDGVCGFAWVNIKPATSAFAKYLKAAKLARSDSYYGGVTVWVSAFNQSMQKKEAYARAFASHLEAAGYKATYNSRMD